MGKRVSHRQLATICYAQLVRIANCRHDNGVVSDVGAWLRAGGNILSAGKAGFLGPRRGREAPEYWGLTVATLSRFARDCRIDATSKEIGRQVAETKAWRAAMSEKLGRPHEHVMQMDRLGEMLGVTEDERREAQAWSIGTVGGSREARRKAASERDRLRKLAKRRDKGKQSRERTKMVDGKKPWQVDGVSRSVWFERRKKEREAMKSGLMSSTCKDAAKPGLMSSGLMSSTCKGDPGLMSSTSIDEGNNAGSGSPLPACSSKIKARIFAALSGSPKGGLSKSVDHGPAFAWLEDAFVINGKQGGLRVEVLA